MISIRPRLDPGCYVGLQRYFLTFCTHHRLPWFTDREIVEVARREIFRDLATFDMAEIVHCFMPDHFHLLLEGSSESADCLAYVRRAKQRTGYAFSDRRRARLWQPSFYDHILRDDEGMLGVARYILENPVRAGLVESVVDYPYLGSSRHSILEILDAVQWRPKWK